MFELYFEELKPDAQKRLLDFVGIERPEQLNWDTFPIVTFERDEAALAAETELPNIEEV